MPSCQRLLTRLNHNHCLFIGALSKSWHKFDAQRKGHKRQWHKTKVAPSDSAPGGAGPKAVIFSTVIQQF
jgi:hypothetical protein